MAGLNVVAETRSRHRVQRDSAGCGGAGAGGRQTIGGGRSQSSALWRRTSGLP